MVFRHRAAFAAPAVFALALVSSLTGSLGHSNQVPKPESMLGWKPCADYKLSTYEEITKYLRAVDRVSDRMKIVDLGKTSEGRDQIMAIVSSPDNLKPENLIVTVVGKPAGMKSEIPAALRPVSTPTRG